MTTPVGDAKTQQFFSQKRQIRTFTQQQIAKKTFNSAKRNTHPTSCDLDIIALNPAPPPRQNNSLRPVADKKRNLRYIPDVIQ